MVKQKNLGLFSKKFNVMAAIGALAVLGFLYVVITRKQTVTDSMGTGPMYMGAGFNNPQKLDQQVKQAADAAPAKPSSGDINNPMSAFAPVSGMQGTAAGLPPSCNAAPSLQADQLLPKDNNSSFQQLAPNGNGALAGVNLLQAGYHNGIDTISSALRNANLQLRSEPPNPTKKVSPWNETTIQPDLMRVPLEIGCGPQ